VLATRLRISAGEARRRLADAEQLGPRAALIGEPLEPVLARLAAAQPGGRLNAEHVRIIRRFVAHLPSWVDPDTRAQAEAQLIAIGCGFKPEELRVAAERLVAMIDQDGEFPRDADRARQRCVRVGRQGADTMTPATDPPVREMRVAPVGLLHLRPAPVRPERVSGPRHGVGPQRLSPSSRKWWRGLRLSRTR
jgi:hypothetical protein